MITEEGFVTKKTGAATAWVKTVPNSACKSCAAHGSCEAAKEGEVEAINEAGANEGDFVIVGFESGSLVKVAMMLYIFPVICMLAGAIAGSMLAPDYGMDESALSAIFAFSAFIISFIFIRLTNEKMFGSSKYKAKIIRIKKSIQ